jgi:hypothetical protein
MHLWKRGTLFATLLTSVAAAPLSANPYTQPKGASALTLSAAVWQFEEYLAGNGDELPLDEQVGLESIEQRSYVLGFEHGLTDQLTLSLTLPWASSDPDPVDPNDRSFTTNEGVSDARIGVKWRLTRGDGAQFALLAGVKWPGDYEPGLINSPGDGSFDVEVGASVGAQIGRFTGSFDAGYRARSKKPADEVLARGEVSYLVGARTLLFTSFDWTNSQSGANLVEDRPVADFTALEEDATRLTAGVLVSFTERFSAFATWARTVDGKNTALGDELGFGLALALEPSR